MTSKTARRIALRAAKVGTVLADAGFPLMTAQEIASVLNKDGSQTKATNVGGTLVNMRRKGIVCKRIIFGGVLDLEHMRWMNQPKYRGCGLKYGFRPKVAYWFLTSRAEEVYPIGAERLYRRDARR